MSTAFTRFAVTALCSGFLSPLLADNNSPGKTFIDYFQPTSIIGTLSKDAWGAGKVGPRDQQNGLEDSTLAQWNYWDGHIIKGPDGKYNLFCSRWDQAKGHSGWGNPAPSVSGWKCCQNLKLQTLTF